MGNDVLNKWKWKAGLAIVISDSADSRPELVRRDKEVQNILIEGTIHQENIMIANIYSPNISAQSFIKQTLLDIMGQIDPVTILGVSLTSYSHQ
jgi:hypothetical protein